MNLVDETGSEKPKSTNCKPGGKKNEKETQIKMREPDLLLIITGGPIAYTRPDGVKIIPLACLKN